MESPAATALASSSAEHVSTRRLRSLSRAASTLFWCVSGTLMIQPSGSWRLAPRRSAWKISLNVSMIREDGTDSGIGLLPGIQSCSAGPAESLPQDAALAKAVHLVEA